MERNINKYATKITYDANIRDDVREIKQVGKNGLKKVLYEVTYRNGSEIGRKKQDETVIEESVERRLHMEGWHNGYMTKQTCRLKLNRFSKMVK